MLRPEEDPAVDAWVAAVRAKHERAKADGVAAASAHGYRLGDDELLPQSDAVNAPSHYTQLPVECIEVAEHFGYLLGNVVKYIWRHQHKGKPLEDLRKARYYLDRAIQKMEAGQ